MRSPSPTASPGIRPGKKPRLLLVVAPPLRRVVEHLLAGLHFSIVARRPGAEAMVGEARRWRPDLILVDAKLLGRDSPRLVSAAKRSSPASKVVLIHHSYGLKKPLLGVDVLVEEEDIVRRLAAILRPLGRSRDRRQRSNTRLESPS